MLNKRKRPLQIYDLLSAILIISVSLAGTAQSATISGTVYSDEGVTPIGANQSVRLLVNGSSAGSLTFEAGVTQTFDCTVNMNGAAV